jgi:uncharacterized membrane protein
MTKEKWYSVIRHTLTFAGGILVIKGTIDGNVAEQVIASVMSIFGVLWGIQDKK